MGVVDDRNTIRESELGLSLFLVDLGGDCQWVSRGW